MSAEHPRKKPVERKGEHIRSKDASNPNSLTFNPVSMNIPNNAAGDILPADETIAGLKKDLGIVPK